MWMLVFLGCSTADAVSCQVYTRHDLVTYQSEMECYDEAMSNYFAFLLAKKLQIANPVCIQAAGDEA